MPRKSSIKRPLKGNEKSMMFSSPFLSKTARKLTCNLFCLLHIIHVLENFEMDWYFWRYIYEFDLRSCGKQVFYWFSNVNPLKIEISLVFSFDLLLDILSLNLCKGYLNYSWISSGVFWVISRVCLLLTERTLTKLLPG